MVRTVIMPQARPSQIKVSGMVDTGRCYHHLCPHLAIIMAHHSCRGCYCWPWGDHTELLEQQIYVGQKSQRSNSYHLTIHYCSTTQPVWEGCSFCVGNPGRNGFLTGATVLKGVKYPTQALQWLRHYHQSENNFWGRTATIIWMIF